MADDLGFQPIQQPADDVGFQPIPKAPDTSGVQRMAQSNLAANDNKEETPSGELKEPQTPAERLNTAIGHPVQSLLNPEDNTPILGDLRRAHTSMMVNGDSVGFGDTINTVLHAVAPVIGGAFQRTEATGRIAEEARKGIGQGYEGGAIIDASDRSDVGQMLGAAANILPQALSSSYSGFQSAAQQFGKEIGNPALGRDIAIFPEAMIGAEGMKPHLPEDYIPHPIKEIAGKLLDKPSHAVTPADIDQLTAQINHKAPAAQDFPNVAAYTGLPEKMLDTVYDATGKTPEDVLVDSQRDPSIPKDISNDEIPKAYEPFIEQRQLPHEELEVARSDSDRVFNVVDKEGDYVQGGFTSAEEAQHYINDKGFEAAEKEALEAREKERATQPIAEEKPQEQPIVPEKSIVQKIIDRITGNEDNTKAAMLQIEQNKLQEQNTSANVIGGEANGKSETTTAGGAGKTTAETRSRAIETLRNDRRSGKTPSQTYTRKSAGNDTGVGVLATYELSPENKKLLNDAGIATPPVHELEKSPESGKTYVDAINASKAQNHFGASVHVYTPEEYAGMRTFLTPDKSAGFALKGDDIVSVFSSKGDGAARGLLELAIQEGGKKLDAFDTNLSDIYADHGFRAISRMKWNDEFAPPNWDKELYNEFNNGEPDVVFMAHDPSRIGEPYQTGEGELVSDYDKAVAMQDKAVDDLSDLPPFLRNKAKTEEPISNKVQQFIKDEEGSGITLRDAIGRTITAAEKFTNKLTGGLFEKLADGYIRTFQPELMGDIAKRADAYLAKYKASVQEAVNSYVRQSEVSRKAFDKLTHNERLEWLYNHETGRWSEADNPDHARMQAMYDALHTAEQEAGVGTSAYKENYLPHQWDNPDAVNKFFRSDAMIKKYGKDWFNKASEFRLVQEGVAAGFKLKTDNPESMLVARQMASYSLRATMDLLKDLERDGIAKRASTFSIDKKIAKTQAAIDELQAKYKKEFEKKNNPKEPTLPSMELPPAESKVMQLVEGRLGELKERLDNFNQEKAANKLTPAQMKELKDNGFKIIGPDNKVWNIHQQAAPVWKNAMEIKGMYENPRLWGKSYEAYMAAKSAYVRTKMLASMWHPTHEVVIDISSDLASAAHHLIQGGKFSDLLTKEMASNIGITKNTFKLKDNPYIESWNTAPALRTPEQQVHVDAMVEGGLVPKLSRQDEVKIRENFDRAISGIGANNLRLVGVAYQAAGLPMAPFMEHWIPGMKAESYFQRRNLALARDPSLLQDAGRRAEVMRGIVKDIERNYGEMNRETQFWNPIAKDVFNATTFSGGWKLAMLQNFRGLLEPAKVAYDFAKTGEFSKEAITHQMLQSYIYTANMLLLGAGLTYLFTGAVGTLKDWINPNTGDKNPDGTPIRLRQPAFFNEPLMLLHDINEDGVVAGTGSFFYHQTQIPAIQDSLINRDFVGRPYITDPTDLQQWKNMGWDSLNPITFTNVARAQEKGSKLAEHMGWLGFPIAGSWVNQTPFEQKVIAAYDRLNPPTGSAYEAKLKSEMKGAIQSKDTTAQKDIAAKMKAEGMTPEQIAHSKVPFKTPFAEFAWKKLSAEDQKRIIESASPEERKKFVIKSQ